MKDYKRISESLIEYKGVVYRRYPESKNRTHRVYYQHHGEWKKTPVFLHRKIYEDYFGPIPEGYHIHHKDGDTENNSPNNLKAISQKEHMSLESSKRWKDKNWVNKRKTYYQSEEHKKKASEAQKNRKKTSYVCELCQERFESRNNTGNVRFCPGCSSHLYSDKNGRHFGKKWQIEKFGKIIKEYKDAV